MKSRLIIALFKPALLAICASIVLLTLASEGQAQTVATSFEALRSNLTLQEGESVRITDDTGRKFDAKVAGISEHSIAVIERGVRREISEMSVHEIRHRKRDVWWNGMLIGLGVGIAAAAVTTAAACQNDAECSTYTLLLALPVMGGIGAGAGAGIDFAIRKHETVYARPANSKRGLSIAPMFSKDGAGARLSFSF